jgi:hypothetical protein
MTEHSRQIYFVVVFWGEKFRNYFADFCLASLVSPNNIPFLSSPEARGVKGKLLICTTKYDFNEIRKKPLYLLLARHIEVELIDIGALETDERIRQQLHMSKGHKAALKRCLTDKAYGSFLAPDMMLSDGSVRTLIGHVIKKTPCVLAPAFRFDLDKCYSRLLARGHLGPDQPLAVSARDFAAIAVESLHSEMLRYEYDEPHFEESPISTIFRRPNRDLVIHTSSWAVAAADFAYLESFSEHHFDENTIDAHFIDAHLFNQPNLPEPILLSDSDEYLMVPLTTEAELPIAPLIKPDAYLEDKTTAQIEAIKISYIRSFLFSHWSDDFKRWAYRRPVHLHSGSLPGGEDAVVEHASAVIARASEIRRIPAPIYFMVAVWGQKYCDLFLTLLLPSMLSPDNAPLLAGVTGCRLLIATTQDDWNYMSRYHLFQRLSYYIEIELVDIGYPGPNDLVQLHMAQGLGRCSRRCFDDKVYGSYLWPDVILSDGTVRRMIELANQGYNAVMVTAPRFNLGHVLHKLSTARQMIPSKPIFLSPRELTRLSADGLHSEFLRFNWDSPHYCHWPISFYVEAPDGFVTHSASWAVLLGNFAALERLADETLAHNTIDAVFLNDNFYQFYQRGEMYVVTQSDKINYLSVTSEQDLTFYPLAVNEHYNAPAWVSESIKLAELGRYLAHSSNDPLKRALYRIPIYYNKEDLTPVWKLVETRTRRIVEKALENTPGLADQAIAWLAARNAKSAAAPAEPAVSEAQALAVERWMLPSLQPNKSRSLSITFLTLGATVLGRIRRISPADLRRLPRVAAVAVKLLWRRDLHALRLGIARRMTYWVR